MPLKSTLCYLLIAINSACIAMIALVPLPLIPLIVLAIVAVMSLFLAYHSIHRKATTRSQDLLLIASIYSFPLVLVLAIYLFSLLVTALAPLTWVLISVYYWLPVYTGLAHLFITAALLALAWKYQASAARTKIILIIYTVVWGVFVAYVVWWYGTKQQFAHL